MEGGGARGSRAKEVGTIWGPNGQEHSGDMREERHEGTGRSSSKQVTG